MDSIDIEFDEIELTVEYIYYEGSENDGDVPGTTEAIDIQDIKEIGVSTYKDFTKREREQIEEIVCDKLNINY